MKFIHFCLCIFICCGSISSLVQFFSLCFKLIIIYYHTQKQRRINFKPRTKLNHNIYKFIFLFLFHFIPCFRVMLPLSCMRHGQRLVMKNFLSQNLGSCGHLALIWKATPPLWVTCLVLLMLCGRIACERQTVLLAHHRWETFREEERLRLSDRNSILMTQNLSGIRSEALIGRRSSFIVLAIVCEWQTKDKRPRRSNVNAMNL